MKSKSEVEPDLDTVAPAAEAPESTADVDDDHAAPGTLYEQMKHLIGVVSSDCTDGSERVSEYFTEGMLQKRREGRL